MDGREMNETEKMKDKETRVSYRRRFNGYRWVSRVEST